MGKQKPSPLKGKKTNSLDDASTGQAFILHKLNIREGIDRQDFEAVMLKEIFPNVDTREPTVDKLPMAPDQHFLLNGGTLGDYVWMIRMEYYIHHTPEPTWLSKRAEESYNIVKEKIEQFVMRTSTEVLHDVKEWHQRLGIR